MYTIQPTCSSIGCMSPRRPARALSLALAATACWRWHSRLRSGPGPGRHPSAHLSFRRHVGQPAGAPPAARRRDISDGDRSGIPPPAPLGAMGRRGSVGYMRTNPRASRPSEADRALVFFRYAQPRETSSTGRSRRPCRSSVTADGITSSRRVRPALPRLCRTRASRGRRDAAARSSNSSFARSVLSDPDGTRYFAGEDACARRPQSRVDRGVGMCPAPVNKLNDRQQGWLTPPMNSWNL